MRLVYGMSDQIVAYVASKSGAQYGPAAGIGIADDTGRIVAGAVYHDYDPDAGVIEVSMAADVKRWLNRAVLFGLLAYPFLQLRCQMLLARTRADNGRVRRIFRALGAVETVIPRLFGRDADGVILQLTDDALAASRFGKGLAA